MLFDNATGADETAVDNRKPDDDDDGSSGTANGAGQLHSGGYLGGLAAFPKWKQPVKTHFRRTAQGWELVGLERLPETVPAAQTLQGERQAETLTGGRPKTPSPLSYP